MADLDRLAPQLPFRQGERVRFQTQYFEGTGRVVGLMPLLSHQNFGVVVEHDSLADRGIQRSPYAAYSTVVVPLYDHVATGSSSSDNDIRPGQTSLRACVFRL